MPKLLNKFQLGRCPHCEVHKPNLSKQGEYLDTTAYTGSGKRRWATYVCSFCGGVVLAWTELEGPSADIAKEWYPRSNGIDETIPERAREYLKQARESLHAPAASIMVCASAVDAMLKAKEYKDGSLYTRIDKAAQDHLLTPEMAKWAHQVRLDANDQRHADEEASLPSTEDAQRSIDFANALAQLLFVLPARVQRGIAASSP